MSSYNQSSHRGRGGRGFRARGTFAPRGNAGRDERPRYGDRDLKSGLSTTSIKTIAVPQPARTEPEVEIKNFEYLASYNWQGDQREPTIIVPGSPREWKNRPLPYQVSPDVGDVFVDQNGFHMHQHVLQPLVAAVDVMSGGKSKENATFPWHMVDIVTDRNGLRKLLRWIAGGADAREFRIDLQLAGKKTVLFNRWEKRYQEEMNGKTYGFSFEKASTDSHVDCENSTGHHRIVTYDLAGLKLVVRFEVDACLPRQIASPVKGKPSNTADVDDLIAGLAKTTLGSPARKDLPVASDSNGLVVLEGGVIRPQSSIIELATRSEYSRFPIDWNDKFPQLYLSQTPHHYLAFHNRGTFTNIEKREADKSADLLRVKDRLKSDLKSLRAALGLIQELAVEYGEGERLTLVFEGGASGKLLVYKRTSEENCLPIGMMDRFKA